MALKIYFAFASQVVTLANYYKWSPHLECTSNSYVMGVRDVSSLKHEAG